MITLSALIIKCFPLKGVVIDFKEDEYSSS